MILDCIKSAELFGWINIAIPFITFFIGMLFIPVAESFKENHRLRKLKKFIVLSLRQISEQVEKQANKIKERADKLEDFNNDDILPFKISTHAIKDIQAIEMSDLFKILVINRKGKDKTKIEEYRKITSTINFFSESIKFIFEGSLSSINELDVLGQKWDESYMKIFSYINRFIGDNQRKNLSINSDEYIKSVLSLRKGLINKYGEVIPNVEITYFEYIIPLIKISQKYTGDERAYLLFNEASKCEVIYKQLNKLRKKTKEYFQISYDNIIKSNSKFKLIIDKLGQEI